MPQVEELNDPRELAALATAWRALWQQTPGASFFQTLEWLQAYFQFQGKSQRLRVLAVSEDRAIVGILPLIVRREATRIGRVRVLTYPLHDWGSFYGPIGPAIEATLTAGLRHIQNTPRDWDLLDLRWIDRDLVDHGATLSAMTKARMPAREGKWIETSIIDCNVGWPAYWASRTSRWRNNVLRNERRLSDAGCVDYRRFRPGEDDPNEELYEACVGLAGQSWQSSARDGTTLSHAAVRDFLRAAHRAACGYGAADINLLYLNRRPIAFAYNYVSRGCVYGLRTGFDATYAPAGAGTVLIKRMIEDSCQRNDVQIDLGTGYLESKRYWQSGTKIAWRCTHFPPSEPRAQLLRWKRAWEDWRQQVAGQSPPIKRTADTRR